MRRTPRFLIIATALALAAGAVVFAAWNEAGAGSSSETADSPASVTVSPATATAPLFPGASGDVALTIDNPNPYPVTVTALALDTGQGTGGFAVDSGHSSCGVGSLSYATQDNGGSGWIVPASGSLPLDLTAAVALDTGAPSACQNASFTVYLQAAP